MFILYFLYNMAYINLHKISDTLYKCDCGKEFNSARSLASHARFCNQYIKVDKTTIYKQNDVYKCECGNTFKNYQSFNAHLSHCDIHHNYNNTTRKLRPSELYHTMSWDNKSLFEIEMIRYRSGQTFSKKQKAGEIINWWKNRHLTNLHKLHIREGMLNYLDNLYDTHIQAHYNKKSIQFINDLNLKNNWHLQHAENGGEIRCLGYFLDGYDKEKNIVFEYDESRHYIDVYNNILSKKDIERQNNIIDKLHCQFWRYNEKIKLLYRVY